MPNRLIDSDGRYRKSLLSVQNVDLWWAGTFDSHSLACGIVVCSYPGNWRTTANSEWLYLKLYCGRDFQNDVLAHQLGEFCEKALANEMVNEWFLVRYADPDDHLRVRFRGVPERIWSELVRVPANLPRGLAYEVLEGIIETDWWVCEKLAKALHAHWLASSAANGSQSSAARPWGALAETFKMANRRRADLIALCSLNGSAFRKMPPDHMTPKAMAKAVNDHFTKIGEPLNVSDKHIIRNVRK